MTQPAAIVTPPGRDLPEGYHLAHFGEMLRFVERVYGPMLGDAHRTFIADFRSLSRDARSLFVRIANRKGRVFRTDQLVYADVGDAIASLAELQGRGLVGPLGAADYGDALAVLHKDAVWELLAESHAEHPARKSWTRPRLVVALRETLDFEQCFGGSRGEGLIAQRRMRELRYLLFLYFGRIEESLTRFALRDLGVVRTHSFRSEFEARF